MRTWCGSLRLVALASVLALAGVLTLAGGARCQEGAAERTPAAGEAIRSDGGIPGDDTVHAPEATRLFLEANAHYADGRYVEAISFYERILSGGFESADVLYNVANAYYKSGRIGRAVIYYERALSVDPGNEDARANLEFVREQLADRQTSVGGPVSGVLSRLWNRASPSLLAASASALLFLLSGLLIVGIVRRVFPPWIVRCAVVVGVLLVLAVGTLGARVRHERTVREGVVVSHEIGVRTGPGSDFVLEFQLHEGTKVRLRDERDGWVRVSIAGTDLEGWLPASSVEEI